MDLRLKVVLIAVSAVFLLGVTRYLDFSEVYGRLTQLAEERGHEPSVESRVLVRHAAESMLREHWVRGVGAGGFRWLFPDYARRYPSIFDNGNSFWEHAHCDWLEIPIELGLAGDLIIAAGFIWWTRLFIVCRAWWSPIVVPLLLGCAQTLLHATFDFPFECPAILVTWCAMLAAAGKWAELTALERGA